MTHTKTENQPMYQPANRLSRRRVIGAGLAMGAAGMLPSTPALAKPLVARQNSGKAKNIIFMVSDGMSMGTLSLAEMARQLKGQGPGAWRSLWSAPGCVRSVTQTHSLSGFVTDSAAAGSAWGIGEHIENGAINRTPDGRTPEPILVTAKAQGKATGLITTTRLTHATPASFIANAKSRAQESMIASQMLERPVDVLLGGGAKHFSDELIASHADLTVVRDKASLKSEMQTGSGRILGLFQDDHMSYTPDIEDHEPTLAEMSKLSLDRLDGMGDGFVLQIEGGRVDHAAHANDALALVADQLAFDDAVAVAVDFVRDRDDTLLIVTTDHGNANPGLTVYGAEGVGMFQKLLSAEHSFEWIAKHVASGKGDIVEAIQLAANVTLRDGEIEWVRRGIERRQPVDPFGPANEQGCIIGSVLANHFGVAFLSPNHTADLVELTAIGPGADRISPFTDNIDLYPLMIETLGLRRP